MRHRIGAARILDLVVVALAGVGIGDGRRQRAGAGVAGAGRDAGAGGGEQIGPQLAVQVHALFVLRIDVGRDGRGQPAQAVLRRDQRVLAELHQAAERAAAELAVVDGDRAGRALVAHRQLRRIVLRCHRRQLVALVALHQRLAVADVDVVLAVAGLHHAGLDRLIERLHQLVALVAQVIGGLAAARGFGLGDLVVERGDLLGGAVDAVDLRLHLGVDLVRQGRHLPRDRVEAGLQGARRAQEDLAGTGAGRIGGQAVGGIEEAGQRRAQAAVAVRQVGVEARDQAVELVGGAAGGLAALHLGGQELIVDALDGRDVDALAEVASPGGHRDVFGLHRFLARIAGRTRVGDVVAGHLQIDIGDPQTGRANIQEGAAHVCLGVDGGGRQDDRYRQERPPARKLEPGTLSIPKIDRRPQAICLSTAMILLA